MRKALQRKAGSTAPDGETFFCGFDSEEEFSKFIIHNSNGDENVWNLMIDNGDGYASISYNPQLQMDDWLVSPAFHLEKGNRYVISIDARCMSSNYPETIAAYLGKGTEVADATITLFEPTRISNLVFSGFGDYFTPEETGDYHLFIHGCSASDMSTLQVDNIRVSSPNAQAVPGEDAIKYNENVLIDSNFDNIGGSIDSPLPLEGADYYLNGADGWRGFDVYGIGGAVMIDFMNSKTDWAQLVPPMAKFTPTDNGIFSGKVILEAKVLDWSDMAASFGNYEAVTFTGMLGSSDCPGGWRWGGDGSDFTSYFSGSGTEWQTMTADILFSGSGNLISDDMNHPYDIVELGTYEYNQLSARITNICGSNIAIRSYKVVELLPELPTVTTWEITSYSPSGFTIDWEPVKEADRYVVELFEGDGTASSASLRMIERKVVTEPSCSFDTDTRDGRFLYVNMFTCKDDIRSPKSPTRRIFSVDAPAFGPLSQPVDGVLTVPVTYDAVSHQLDIFALAGKRTSEAVNDFSIADISFAGFKDSEAGENTPYTYYLNEQANGWKMYPAASFEGGAFKCNNSAASWGMADYMTIIGDCAYDFSQITGNIRVYVTAKTDGNCSLSVNLKDFDAKERMFYPYASASVTLDKDYATYMLEVDPQQRKNVAIEITTGGQDTNYIKDVKVMCDIPADVTFLMPVVIGSLEVMDSGKTSTYFRIEMPEDIDLVRVTGQAVRNLYTIEDGKTSLYYIARSPFAENADVKVDPSGIDEFETDNADDIRYYDLNGMRVSRPVQPGIYVKTVNGKSEKVIIK